VAVNLEAQARKAVSLQHAQMPALDELLSIAGIIFFRKVVLETAESAAQKLECYQQLREQLGFSDAQLAVVVGPEARAMLLYLQQVSALGEADSGCRLRVWLPCG
jgi:hypothetical protein